MDLIVLHEAQELSIFHMLSSQYPLHPSASTSLLYFYLIIKFL